MTASPSITTDPRPRRRQSLVSTAALASAVYLPALFVLVVMYQVAERLRTPFATFTRDPAMAVGAEFYAGCLSNLGAMLWCTGAVVALFSYVATRHVAPPRWRFFFLGWGVLTALVMADDLFLLHDGLLPVAFGAHEAIVYGAYGLFGLACLIFTAPILRQTPLVFLFAAGLFLACSLAFDAGIVPVSDVHRHVFEDGGKLLGALGWCSYLVGTCVTEVRRLLWPVTATVAAPLVQTPPVTVPAAPTEPVLTGHRAA